MKLILGLLFYSGLAFAASSAPSRYTGVSDSTEELTGFIETATDKTYVLDQSAAYNYQVQSITIGDLSGTVTAALKIGGTNITSCNAVSVTSTAATTTCTAANNVAAGSRLTLVTSSTSSALDVAFTIKLIRN